ncbi:uncharacterized protein PV07_07064 [Cladophialophora immunda]|uniref:NADP-dependent oxidoreductase domain-containing protein n=1 Tax=Cladophialophora immunda TaxID=569365 RepID=A0A0D2C852_9EURO|nr:uncharacterized protein PV07_07064 [Cladophialophora immunda]KIW27313.1 hypothetical protein PV07_07064 [Cladophialophora immunda]
MIYGTAWKGDQTADLVAHAFEAGFRAFDTAAQPRHYREELVGKGIRICVAKFGAKREDLYIQTKFLGLAGQGAGQEVPYDPASSLTEQVRTSIIGSLSNLAPEEHLPLTQVFIDCLILHAPFQRLEDTLSLQELQGLCQHVKIKPSVVQNAFHSGTKSDVDVRKFCVQNGIVYQAFSTLTANPELLSSDFVSSLASEAGMERAVALYYLIEKLENVNVLNGTTKAETMKRDLEQVLELKDWASSSSHAEELAVITSQFRAYIGERDEGGT